MKYYIYNIYIILYIYIYIYKSYYPGLEKKKILNKRILNLNILISILLFLLNFPKCIYFSIEEFFLYYINIYIFRRKRIFLISIRFSPSKVSPRVGERKSDEIFERIKIIYDSTGRGEGRSEEDLAIRDK